mmetsp:Transcript_26212/g.65887  ORF Transcript_26212/g.65887 Transcript_26212/m.65887 type:complete len:228 (-) Transcript_26212:194-877(-)
MGTVVWNTRTVIATRANIRTIDGMAMACTAMQMALATRDSTATVSTMVGGCSIFQMATNTLASLRTACTKVKVVISLRLVTNIEVSITKAIHTVLVYSNITTVIAMLEASWTDSDMDGDATPTRMVTSTKVSTNMVFAVAWVSICTKEADTKVPSAMAHRAVRASMSTTTALSTKVISSMISFTAVAFTPGRTAVDTKVTIATENVTAEVCSTMPTVTSMRASTSTT